MQQYLPFTVLKLQQSLKYRIRRIFLLQQYLPFTVLKPLNNTSSTFTSPVATVLTVYGIETLLFIGGGSYEIYVATVLTVYGIETLACLVVAGAVLLACCNSTYRLRY